MKQRITARTIASLQITGLEYEVHDATVPGLFIRVTAAGSKSYAVTWARGRKKTLGRVGVLTLAQAQTEALQYLNEARIHGEPLAVTHGRRGAGIPTLKAFIDDQFEAWALTHHKDGAGSVREARSSFEELMKLRLDEIDVRRVERLRSGWIAAGRAPATANRKLVRLKGILTRAVEWGVISDHPLAGMKRLKVDRRGRVRYLLADEEQRLREAMDAREEEIRAERDSGNKWRNDRKRDLMPDLRLANYADHLKPLVLLSINTGMRRGEVFNLQWRDVDLKNKIVTVEGDTSKSGQTRHIPLNREALAVLEGWADGRVGAGFIFPGKAGERLNDVKKSWAALLVRAGITGFRWHDLRHTFASKLVMAGVPLNTVRELLGHSDIQMTLRYAHLAPDSKAQAVELI